MRDETPTPRTSAAWDMWASAAAEVAERLRAMELREDKSLVSGDRARGFLARQVRHVAESYMRAFHTWKTRDVPLEDKHRQQQEFAAFNTFAREVLRGHP